MSTILKLMVLLALVFALIPTSSGNSYSIVGIFQNTKKDLAEFCVRNPETCTQTRHAYNSAKEKLTYLGEAISYVVKHAAIDTAALDSEAEAQSNDRDLERSNKEKKADALYDTEDDKPFVDKGSTLQSEDLLDEWMGPET